MSFRRSKRVVLLLCGAAISVALMQQTTTIARSRMDDAPKAAVLLPLRITDTDSGSQITVPADDALAEILTRMIGAWFELRIRNADASQVQSNFLGRGFEQGHVLQSGGDAVFMFRLRPGMTARVLAGTNSLDVIISLSGTPDPAATAARQANEQLMRPRTSVNKPAPASPAASTPESTSSTRALVTSSPKPALSDLSSSTILSTRSRITSTLESDSAQAGRPLRVSSPPKSERALKLLPGLTSLSSLQVTDMASGSRVTIGANQRLNRYSSRYVGDWFEVRIQDAEAREVRANFEGAGFQAGHVVQSGSDAVLLFRVQTGVGVNVVPAGDRLEVNFLTAARPLLVNAKSAEFNSAPAQIPAKNLELPALSKLKLEGIVSAPPLSFASEAHRMSTVLVSEEPPPPPKAIAKNPPPPLVLNMSFATKVSAPPLNFPSETYRMPTVLISEEPPPPPKPIAKTPPALLVLNVSFATTVSGPQLNFPSEAYRMPTVLISEEPPPPPKLIAKNPLPPPSLRLNVATTIPIAMTAVTGDLPRLLPTVSLPDEPPPPPAPIRSASENAAIERSSVVPNAAPTAADKPVEKTEAAEAAKLAAADVGTVTETENSAPVDPTKPAPAQINLPKAPLPRPRGRASLSPERRIELSGVVSIDYSKTNQTTTPETGAFGNAIKNRGHNFGVGLDMHLGTFLMDPRFLKLSFDTGFTTNRGGFDEFATRQGNKGAGLYVDFLPTSQYPFRFHFTRQNTHFLEQQISSASTGRRSLGFDWSLRKPHFPNLSVNFEDTSYASRFVASSSFKSQSKTLSLSLTDKVKGWDVNSNFSKQSATEGITNLKTGLDFLRFDARRQLSSKSNLFVNSFFEKLHFDNPRTRLGQDFSFFDVHTDFSLQQTEKLSFRAAHQFYYSSNDQTATSTENKLPATSDVPAPTSAPLKSVTSFNSALGQVNYRLWSALQISGTASARFISTPETKAETATRFLDFTAGISWNKRLGFAETRASFVEGVTQVRSSFGESRGVQFRSYSAGLSMGKVSRALVTADFNSTSRPDAFQIGGFFSQRYFDVAVETHAVSRFQIRASAGQNLLDYLTASGREHLHTSTYSLSIDDKWFTVLLSHNSNSGVRDVFLVPITLDNTRIFRLLPVDSLLRDPLLNGAGVFTLGLVRFKPRRGLDVEIRYLRDKVLFARTNDVFTQQFDILARYKLGQITLTSGLIFFQQDTEGLFRRDRNYFFFRLSRPFTLF